MRNLFVYETPHPAHRAFAESIGCEIPPHPSQAKPGFVDRWRTRGWYRKLSRKAFAVRRTIEATARTYTPPDWTPDILLVESWRQTAVARHFPAPFRVLIAGDWFPFVFSDDRQMQSYLEPYHLIVAVSEVTAHCIPAEVNPNVVVVNSSTDFELGTIGEGRDCVFIGDVFEVLKGVRHSVRLFETAFDDGRTFHVVGRCARELEGKQRGNVIYHGRVSDARLREILVGSRYYLHWADYEAWGVSTVEAMSYGLIPITSPNTGTHVLTKEVLGDRIRFTTPEEVGRQLKLFDDGGEWEPLRAKCAEVSRRYTVERSKEAFSEAVMMAYDAWKAGSDDAASRDHGPVKGGGG